MQADARENPALDPLQRARSGKTLWQCVLSMVPCLILVALCVLLCMLTKWSISTAKGKTKADPFANVINQLYDLATTPTNDGGANFSARLNAIDTIGQIGKASPQSVPYLQKLLHEVLDVHSVRLKPGERPLFAQHVVEALGNVGPNAQGALADISKVIDIDPALLPDVQTATSKILAQSTTKPTP